MVEFIDEVKEELRRERTLKFLKTYGKYIVGVVVIAITIGGSFVFHLHREEQRQLSASEKFYHAVKLEEQAAQVLNEPAVPEILPGEAEEIAEVPGMQEADEANVPAEPAVASAAPVKAEHRKKQLSAADEFSSVMEDDVRGFSELAGIRQAGLLAQMGEIDAAIDAYDKVATDKNAPVEVRDLASLQAVSLLIDHPKTDKSVEADIDTRLEDLSGTLRPWRYSALELMAFRKLDKGLKKEALAVFEELMRDPQIPQAMFERTTKVVKLLRRDVEPYDPFAESAALDAVVEQPITE